MGCWRGTAVVLGAVMGASIVLPVMAQGIPKGGPSGPDEQVILSCVPHDIGRRKGAVLRITNRSEITAPIGTMVVWFIEDPDNRFGVVRLVAPLKKGESVDLSKVLDGNPALNPCGARVIEV